MVAIKMNQRLTIPIFCLFTGFSDCGPFPPNPAKILYWLPQNTPHPLFCQEWPGTRCFSCHFTNLGSFLTWVPVFSIGCEKEIGFPYSSNAIESINPRYLEVWVFWQLKTSTQLLREWRPSSWFLQVLLYGCNCWPIFLDIFVIRGS